MKVTITHKGNFSKTYRYLKKDRSAAFRRKLTHYGQRGVEALSLATPRDTGKTAESWSYEIVETKGLIQLIWTNSNNNHGVYIAVLIQYGHGTKNGGYVAGVDYINPAMRPIFENMAEELWKEVIKDE